MTDGYWYPCLNRTGYDTRTPWSPAYRNPDGSDGGMLNMEFESAGAVMAYLKRAGLAAWDERTSQVSLAKGMSDDDVTAFQNAWKRGEFDRVMVLSQDMEITPLETSPAGPESPDDDRWEWINIATYADDGPVWTKGACRHRTPEPVDAYPTGELVAWLCVDCGQEFDPDRWPVPEGMWRRIPVLFEDGPSGSLHKINGQPVLRADDDELHDHWLVSGMILLSRETKGLVKIVWDELIEPVWYWIKAWAEIAWLMWPVILVIGWYVGIILGWWSE